METRQSTTCWFVCGTPHTWSIIMIFTSIFRFCFTSFPKKFKWTTAFETVDSVSAISVVQTRTAVTLVCICRRYNWSKLIFLYITEVNWHQQSKVQYRNQKLQSLRHVQTDTKTPNNVRSCWAIILCLFARGLKLDSWINRFKLCAMTSNNRQRPTTDLPAYRRLLFPLLHAEKGRLRNTVAISCSSVSLGSQDLGNILW